MLAAASRRALLSVAALASLPPPLPSSARVKGAAEMDLEFYARSVLGRSTSPTPTARPPPVARKLDERIAEQLLSATVTGMAPSLALSPKDLRTAAVQRRSGLAIEYDRVNAVGAFGGGTGYDVASFGERTSASLPNTQQFGFDLSALALFSLLGDARKPRSEVADAYRRIGDELLGVFPAAATCADRDSIVALVSGMRVLLGQLKTAGYIEGFSLDDSDVDEALWQQRSSLSPTRLSVTLNDSATLRAALLLNGRGVTPELARPLLTAYLARCGAKVTEESEFFLDDYRESPLEYRASQTLLSFTVAPARANS